MYKVLIVDDEIRICKLIRRVINWEEMGFEIIDEANDGLTALEKIEAHQPDLVLTDIRMPGIDGIGLIKAARQSGLKAEFVIISGYSDFEYARSAIDYDAIGYLLKPIDEDKLKEMLNKVKDRLMSASNMKEKLQTSNKRMLEQDMLGLIRGTHGHITMEDLNANYNTNFTEGFYCTILLKQDLVMKSISESNYQDEFSKDVFKLKVAYGKYFHEMVFLKDQSKSQLILVVNMNQQDAENILPTMKLMKRQLKVALHRENNVKITIGLGKVKQSLTCLGDSYKEASNAIKARIVLGTDKVIDATKISEHIYNVKNIIDVREEKKLLLIFDVLDSESAETEIAKVFKEASEKYHENFMINHLVATEIINILYKVMVRKNGQGADQKQLNKDLVLQRLNDCLSKEEMATMIHQVCKSFIDGYALNKKENGSQIIAEIKSYVSKHYMDDISLDDVAKLVCLNPSYVSGVFRKKSGENFSEYLTNYRIEIAKDLLNDVKYKIVDISYMVGYRDSKYFSRIFKKKVGVNPRDYRKLYI